MSLHGIVLLKMMHVTIFLAYMGCDEPYSVSGKPWYALIIGGSYNVGYYIFGCLLAMFHLI